MTSSRARRGALVGAVVAILVGILTMHVLTGPGSDADQASSTPHTSSAHGVASEHAPPTAPGHDQDHLVVLCAAMLASAAVALLLRPAHGAPARPLARLARVAVRPGPCPAPPSGTGPPPAYAFSVVRC